MTPEPASRTLDAAGRACRGVLEMAAGPHPALLLLAGACWPPSSGPGRPMRCAATVFLRSSALTFQRVVLEPGAILATVLNDGPDPVTISQVVVDDAFWTFTAESGTRPRSPWADDAADSVSVGAGRDARRARPDVDRHRVRARDPGRGRNAAAERALLRHLHADRAVCRRHPRGDRAAVVPLRCSRVASAGWTSCWR